MMPPPPRTYPALVIVGPSGVGKSTLINRLLADYPTLFELSVSLTTRKPRPGQVEGKDYHFVSEEEFRKEVENQAFTEYCSVHGNLYGTNKNYLGRIVASGRVCLLDVDIQGAQKIHQQYPDFVYYFIEPPSMELLQKRLRGRKTESEERLRLRLSIAEEEVARSRKDGFFRALVNEELGRTYQKLKEMIATDLGMPL